MLKRKEYPNIIDWIENDRHHALLVTGARQIGKTYLIRAALQSQNISYVEFNFIEEPGLASILDGVKSVEMFYDRLTVATKSELIPGETVIFFDEVQECKDIMTWIKFLVEDGRFRYILSGSLLGVELKGLRSAPVGFVRTIDMYPMDLFEFFTAMGVRDTTIDGIRDSYKSRRAMDDFIHEKLMRLFDLYLVIGGMPEAVQKYIDTNDVSKAGMIQRDILSQYKNDFTKYEKEHKLRLIEIYDAIPGELQEKNKRFFLSHLGGKAAFDRVENSFIWLKDAGVALPVYNVTEPKSPLKISEKRNLFKLFMSDVGLLTCQYPDDVKMKILQEQSSINNGGIYENYVAQELKSKKFELYYFNSKKQGELDFVIELNGNACPVEVKSGKDYEKHSALGNCINDDNYIIEEAFVLCNGNLKREGSITYLPIYMTACIENNSLERFIYKPDISGL